MWWGLDGCLWKDLLLSQHRHEGEMCLSRAIVRKIQPSDQNKRDLMDRQPQSLERRHFHFNIPPPGLLEPAHWKRSTMKKQEIDQASQTCNDVG